MGSFSDRAYILHQRPYRESSVIVDLLTENHGRLSAVCKGVRSSSKKASLNRAMLQLFQELHVTLSGRGELKTIIQLDSVAKAYRYEKHNLYAALYVNELLVRLMKSHDGLSDIYAEYKEALLSISQSLQDLQYVERALRLFELSLLKKLGFAIDFFKDHDNVPVNSASHYSYHPEQGFSKLSGQDEKRYEKMPVVISGVELERLQSMLFDAPSTLSTLKKITRHALQSQLGDKPLQSRLFYQKL